MDTFQWLKNKGHISIGSLTIRQGVPRNGMIIFCRLMRGHGEQVSRWVGRKVR